VSAVARAMLSSWSLPPGLVVGVMAVALVYARGWRRLRLPAWRLQAFAGGLGALALAVASPLDAFARFLLTAHMLQHLLLLAIAPPLLLLGAPARALLRGLPRALAREALGPFLAAPALARIGRALALPLVGVLVLTATTWGWHAPRAYELALRSPAWHQLEHASFFGAALLFWRPVVDARRLRWELVPCLLLADLQNTALAALLVFSDRVLYGSYATVPRLFGLSALDDQIAAGVIMWVPGSLVFLVPAMVLCIRWLSPPSPAHARARTPLTATAGPQRFDLLRAPIVGRLLRARHGRRLLQLGSLAIACWVVVDGIRGPRAAPMNLAGIVPWIWWRPLTVLTLLTAGNFFCMACPFTLPRELGRRFGHATRAWPRALRGKWIGVGLLATFFVAQEQLGWWDAPRATAFLVIAYFVAALAVDSLVRGASFCKYVCPIGQFQFVGSLVSPLEVKVRLPVVCADCETKDCLRGNARQRGCELDLYLPRKQGNLDCTFCLDCVKACPYDNIGILAVAPGRILVRDRPGASIGRISQRLDVALLALVVVLAAFALGAVMVAATAPARLVAGGLVIASSLLVAGRVALGATLFCRLALALVPLGMGMWAAHLSFHLATGWRSLLPVVERAAGLGDPDWSLACSGVASDRLVTFELLLLDAGLLFSLYLGWRIARTVPRYLPFAIFAAALWAAGVWIILSPMQMRGMLT
jgi:cytochrome c oxidase assembly factor CtaG/ferredoxin